MQSSKIWSIGYLVVVLGMAILFFQQGQQKTAVKEARASTVACVVRVLTETNNASRETREAAQKRDDALVGSKRALRELIRLRVIEQTADSEQVQQAAEQYMTQTHKFIKASKMLDKSRDQNPVPNPNKVCK